MRKLLPKILGWKFFDQACYAKAIKKDSDFQSASLPPFDPQTVIRDLGNGNAFRISDAQTGVICFGATGSGKSSGPYRFLITGYLARGFSMLVLCCKPDEAARIREWAKSTNREKDVIIFDGTGEYRFNPLACEAARSTPGGRLSLVIVNLIDEISTAITGSGGAGDEGSGSDSFWTKGLRHMITIAVDLCIHANLPVSLPLLRDIISSAPMSDAEVADPHWKSQSQCAAVLEEADRLTANGPTHLRCDFEDCRDYWLKTFPRLSEKTRSILVLMFAMIAKPLLSHPFRTLFSSDTNITPEECIEQGKILVIDLPIATHGVAGRMAAMIWKYTYQQAILRRVPPKDSYLRPACIVADEAQFFFTPYDAVYQSVARSAGGCSFYLTQNYESILRVLRNRETVDSLLSNLQCILLCKNVGPTNEWAANLLGHRWIHATGTSAGHGQKENDPWAMGGSNNFGINRSEQRRFIVEPSRFTTLKSGGALNDYQVEVICYQGGRLFPSDSSEHPELLPYFLLTINQK